MLIIKYRDDSMNTKQYARKDVGKINNENDGKSVNNVLPGI